MTRSSTLIPAFLLAAGLAMSGYAVAQAANDSLASPGHATITVASNDCVGHGQSDLQNCYSPNRAGRHASSAHST